MITASTTAIILDINNVFTDYHDTNWKLNVVANSHFSPCSRSTLLTVRVPAKGDDISYKEMAAAKPHRLCDWIWDYWGWIRCRPICAIKDHRREGAFGW